MLGAAAFTNCRAGVFDGSPDDFVQFAAGEFEQICAEGICVYNIAARVEIAAVYVGYDFRM